ncbi:erythromycin esterase [Agromyces sp. CF514]|uniref:erythromycin esterase family protein n=1 Tax=Agromyces sp. CF514 TaxID=1881031 RepID=UPI0008F26D5A|nr:erythromycin esterase family protein [Agromyces sp. CF514]SFR73648.1 erythromycin esterase [Agromyces sp. CF514]
MTDQDDDLSRWLRTHAHDLATTDPDADDDRDLERLLDIVGDARIVAIGESMHRVHEFLDVRHRILRFLVRRAGFTALVMEGGFAEALTVDRWISTGGPGVRRVLNRGLTYHFGKSQEMLDQVAWMRARAVGPEAPVRLYGMDLPDSAASALPAVQAVLELLDEVDVEYARHVRAELLPIFDYLPGDRSGLAQAAPDIHAYLALPASTRHELTARISDLVERVGARSVESVAATGDPARVAVAVRAAESARAADAFLAAMTAGPTRTWPPANIRDRAMADTVDWILEREPRIVVAAANGHVQKSPFLAPPFVTQPMTTLGQHLEDRWGDDYVVLGSAYGGGSTWLHRPAPEDAPGHSTPFIAALAEPDAESLDGALGRARPGRDYFVDLRTSSDRAAAALDATKGSQQGDHVQLLDARRAYDGVIRLDRVSPWHTWIDEHGLAD